MSGECEALSLALHRTLCDNGRVTPTINHPWHQDDAREVIVELKRWQIHVVNISPFDEFPALTVGADGSIAA